MLHELSVAQYNFNLLGQYAIITSNYTPLKYSKSELIQLLVSQKIFQFKNPKYNLSFNANTFLSRKIRSTFSELNSTQYLSTKIWEQVPENILLMLTFFTNVIKFRYNFVRTSVTDFLNVTNYFHNTIIDILLNNTVCLMIN